MGPSDPREAYGFLKSRLDTIAAGNSTKLVVHNGEVVADREHDSEEHVSALAQVLFMGLLPNENYEAFDLTVKVYPEPDPMREALFGKCALETVAVCEISHQSENLAN